MSPLPRSPDSPVPVPGPTVARATPGRPGLLLAAALALGTGGQAADVPLELPEGERVVVVVPEGWKLARDRGENGVVTARLTDPGERLSLHLTFLPHLDGRLAGEEAQARVLGELIEPYLAHAVEKEARLQPLRAHRAEGFYCLFTDARLVDRRELPPDEYRHATVGLRVAERWFAVFTLFSQDTTSAEYRAALRVVQIGLRDAGGGSRGPRVF
jgi:hypothetical protein